MARQTRPIHILTLAKGDYIDIKGFGDCRVLTDPRYLSEGLDIVQFWVKTPLHQIYSVCVPEESYINIVEFVDDDDEFTKKIERVMICQLHKGDKFYLGRHKVAFLGQTGVNRYQIKTMSGRVFNDMPINYFMVVHRVKKVRRAKPLSFTEFALSSYEKVLGRLAKAVMRLQMDPARVEVQKPTKKAENASIITAEDVPSPAPVEPPFRNYGPKAFDCDDEDDCDRSYCVECEPITLDNIQARHYDGDRVLTCSDVIAELEEVRQHEGDLPVSIVNPEDGFRRVNVSGSMLEDLYECGETYWGSRTYDTQPRPGNPAKSELVVSLW